MKVHQMVEGPWASTNRATQTPFLSRIFLPSSSPMGVKKKRKNTFALQRQRAEYALLHYNEQAQIAMEHAKDKQTR